MASLNDRSDLQSMDIPEDRVNTQDQTEEEIQTVKLVEKLFNQAKRARAEVDRSWVEYYKFFRGKQWRERRPSYRHSEVMNFTHAAIQTIVPILTDTRPRVEVLPENPDDFEFAEVLNKVITSKWDRDMWGRIVAEAIVDASIYGTALAEVPWDPELDRGLGDFDFKTVDPLYFYPDPNAEDINDAGGDYMITAVPTDVKEVRLRYPDKAEFIKSDLNDLQDGKEARKLNEDVAVRSAVDSKTLVEGGSSHGAMAKDKVLLITLWQNPKDVEEEEFDDEETGEKKFRTKLKYPNGRKIVIASGMLLEDTANPYLDSKFPFARLVDHILPREFWGEGEVKQLMGPQRMINKLISYVMDTLILMGNPIWMVPTNSGVDTNNLFNSPGLVVEHNPEARPHRETGVQLQPFILQTFDRLVQLFDKVSGIHEVSQGAAPSANSSGIAIERLQEAAQTKLRQKSRNVERFLTQAGQLMVSRILQFYKAPRIVRLTADEGDVRFFKFAVEEITDEHGEVQRIANITPFAEQVDEFGQPVGLGPEERIQAEIKGQFDVRITTGSALPFAKAQKAAQSEKLLQMGIIDAEDHLKNIEWPGAEKIIEKLKQREEAAAAAEPPPPEEGV